MLDKADDPTHEQELRSLVLDHPITPMYRSSDWQDGFQIPLRWLDPVEPIIFSLVGRTVAAKEAG